MRVFVTGATGFIGSAVVKELVAAGHQVLGLCRSDEKAAELAEAGAEVHRGSLEDLDSLKEGAARSDGVIHLAFNHDFSKFVANCEDDRRVIKALGSVLVGSDRPLIVTSGTGMAKTVPGQPAREDGAVIGSDVIPRAASEEAAASVAAEGVNVAVVRLPQVHDTVKQGLVTYAIAIAREKGVFPYVGDGLNRWPAAHVLDAARLYRLAIERGEPGAKYHAVAEEGVPIRDMAEVIGRRLKLPVLSIAPEEAEAHFGWLALFVGLDAPASSEQTRKKLGWQPTGPGLIADLERLHACDTQRGGKFGRRLSAAPCAQCGLVAEQGLDCGGRERDGGEVRRRKQIVGRHRGLGNGVCDHLGGAALILSGHRERDTIVREAGCAARLFADDEVARAAQPGDGGLSQRREPGGFRGLQDRGQVGEIGRRDDHVHLRHHQCRAGIVEVDQEPEAVRRIVDTEPFALGAEREIVVARWLTRRGHRVVDLDVPVREELRDRGGIGAVRLAQHRPDEQGELQGERPGRQ